MSNFKIFVAPLLNYDEPYREVSLEEKIKPIEFAGDKVKFKSKLKVEVEIKRTSKGLVVKGSGEVLAIMHCSRCLREFLQQIKFEINEIFAQSQMKEFFPEEVELFPIENDSIDLFPMLRQLIVLSLPFKPLCSEECKGICPRCGADLNEGSCGCGEDAIDVRWEPLKKLKQL